MDSNLKAKFFALDRCFKIAADFEDPRKIAEAHAKHKLALVELYQIFKKITAVPVEVIAKPVEIIAAKEDSYKIQIEQLKEEIDLQYSVIKDQGEKVFRLTNDAAAREKTVTDLVKENEKIPCLSEELVAKGNVIEGLIAEKAVLEDFISSHTKDSGKIDEIDALNFQVSQHIRRNRLTFATVENLKTEKAGLLINLGEAKEALKGKVEENHVLCSRIIYLEAELESIEKSAASCDSYDSDFDERSMFVGM